MSSNSLQPAFLSKAVLLVLLARQVNWKRILATTTVSQPWVLSSFL